MYPAPFHYHRVSSVAEATGLLAELGENARPLAGGQSLLALMKLRIDQPEHLVDIGRIPGLDVIEVARDVVRIGALARHVSIARSRIAESVPIVADCARGIADNQVRNRGTIGGNVSIGDPSCDWPTLLLALDAELMCEGPGGRRRAVAIGAFARGLYTTVLEAGEIVTGIGFRLPRPGSGGAYCVFKRCAPAYPTSAVAIQLRIEDGLCTDVRIGLGASGLTALRATRAESELRGNSVDGKTVARVAEAAAAEAEPVEDQRGSEAFKRHLLKGLVSKALDIAARRSRGERVENPHEYY